MIDVLIEHDLLAVPGAKAEDVKTVVSHPQALAQCGEYIRAKGFETRAYSNTALAAEYVKNAADKSIAAIASADTAEIFGLCTVDKGINDNRNNTTRFASFSRAKNKPRIGCENGQRKLHSRLHGSERVGCACKRAQHHRRAQFQYAFSSFPSHEKSAMELLFLHRSGRKRQHRKRQRDASGIVRSLCKTETRGQLFCGQRMTERVWKSMLT